MKYVIGTGWWCDNTGLHSGSKVDNASVDTRKVDFFELWYSQIVKNANPLKIIITDSNSPVKPQLIDKSRVGFISLIENFGHALDEKTKGKLSGWERAFLNGAFYTLLNDIDYYVFIEQDALIFGNGIIEHVIEGMGENCYTHGINKYGGIEQSFVIIKIGIILDFINKLIELQSPNEWIIPESKWAKLHQWFSFQKLPFGYGGCANRPINYSDKYWYAQHFTENELCDLKRLNLI